ncbi:hypothetical protein FQA39_LY16818 [Lamprigera yunnana]|nr:hypothetical protein FQA39_LY16818 [Lamprigera yunnana]
MMSTGCIACLSLFALVCCFSTPIAGVEKVWLFNNNVLDPSNWENGTEATNCRGFLFPEVLGSVGSVTQLQTSAMVLPIMGELEIQNGGYIEFSDRDFCVRVKQIKPRHWLDPANWGASNNSATPDAERVPCVYDDVIFPNNDFAVLYPELSVSVNSIQIRGTQLSHRQWDNFLQSDYGIEQFQKQEFTSNIVIVPKTCGDKSGCACHDDVQTEFWVCDHVSIVEPKCFKPIQPIGFCNKICGAAVYLNATDSFFLESFRFALPKSDEVDVHASKVLLKQIPTVQVVFREKEYKEYSTRLAKEFYETLPKDGAKIELSGMALPEGSRTTTAFSIIFGTLVGAFVVFLCIYVLYLGPLRDSRIPLGRFVFRDERQYFFHKFDDKDVSRATSMVSLEKSFDNPMYGSVPSTSGNVAGDVASSSSTSSADNTVATVVQQED